MVSDGSIVKFLCSYGGKIVPRPCDGKLRYCGGTTRVLAVDRSISFAELLVRLGEFCGYSVELRCLLPKGDLEVLVSIKSDEELRMILEEYDRASPGSKIKAVLCPPKGLKKMSPPSSVDLFSAIPGRGEFAFPALACQPRQCGREGRGLMGWDAKYRRYQN